LKQKSLFTVFVINGGVCKIFFFIIILLLNSRGYKLIQKREKVTGESMDSKTVQTHKKTKPPKKESSPDYIFQCPHCLLYVVIAYKDFNCRIFRHGVHKNNMKQINPHLSEEVCTKLAAQQSIIGCGKPFKIVRSPNEEAGFKLIRCGYI